MINLYKQDLTDKDNFPRVTRKDFFKIIPGQTLKYPDPKKEGVFIDVTLPQFDCIISNFPFIQQEDILNKQLTKQFRQEFQKGQKSFMNGNKFDINERSDYSIYCFYNSLKFLKPDGYISAITSNAWLGKNYGNQFKRFLLDNFSIRHIFRSNAEHWFHDSKVSTIFISVQNTIDDSSTRFVTINKKLEELFPIDEKDNYIETIDELYNEINHCNYPENENWTKDSQFPSLYHKKDGTVSVSIIDRNFLEQQIASQENWVVDFLAQDPLQLFRPNLINPFPDLMDVGRGTRADTDKYQILTEKVARINDIEKNFLIPAIKSSREITSIKHILPTSHYLFSCNNSENDLAQNYPNSYKWVKNFSKDKNKKGILYPKVLNKRKPYWYSLRVEEPANLFISINPHDKLFFAYSIKKMFLNQRLVSIRVPEKNLELFAALLNSIISILIVEFNGVSRNLGALDLNADFFKNKMKILNPNLLTEDAKDRIIEAFKTLAKRPVLSYNIEYKQKDRIKFDEVVLKEFGYDITILPELYNILTQTIRDRIEMKKR